MTSAHPIRSKLCAFSQPLNHLQGVVSKSLGITIKNPVFFLAVVKYLLVL